MRQRAKGVRNVSKKVAVAVDTKKKRNPMRGCKLGVSYAEIESNDGE